MRARHAAVTVTIEQSAPRVNVIALLYDVDERNRAVLITRGALLSKRSGTASFDLMPQDWHLRAGHRLGLLLTGADDGLLEPGLSGTAVQVVGGTLSLPFLSTLRTSLLDGEPSRRIKERGTFAVDPAGSEVVSSFPPPLRTRDATPRRMRLGVKPARR